MACDELGGGIGEAFFRSLAGYSEQEGRVKRRLRIAGSVDEALGAMERQSGREPLAVMANDGMFMHAIRAVVLQELDRFLTRIWNPAMSAGSPIERSMLYALYIVARDLKVEPYICLQGQDDNRPMGPRVRIEPQAEIGPYRADFRLTMTLMYQGPPFERVMIVECDGHDFHDRTKEQARSDRERDRFLQGKGYRVYRYTGSDIWSDVFGCAYEALTSLFNEIMSTLKGRPAGFGVDFAQMDAADERPTLELAEVMARTESPLDAQSASSDSPKPRLRYPRRDT